ncbi:MAG: cell wall-binding repeat-containing protein [Coriobacteriia bacterium]|nr:cell wall-binding repeat-containing protein [Coriobacteriia bacterium]MBN2848740.1 cell wall-binding repeat-containing protein [Coriobacteriia bacterium]
MPHHIAVPLATALLAATVGFTGTASAATVPYFARFAAQEAMLSEMAIQPAALRVGDVTYLAFQGPGFDPYIASYESETATWRGPTRIGTNPLRLDAHGAPSLYVDPAGRVHAFYGAHWTPILHARQNASGPDATWQSAPSLPVGTYPQAVPLGGSDMLVFYRGTSGTWFATASHDGATSFGTPQAVLAGTANLYWYADFRVDDGTVRAVFTWVDQDLRSAGLEFVRRHVYYAERAPDGVWRAADGSTLALPITKAVADERCRIVDSRALFTNEVSVKVDAEGAPCVIYLIGSGSGPDAYRWCFMRRENGIWRTSTITTTDHFFDAAALDPRPDGSFDVFAVTGDSDAVGSDDGDYRGRGGRIERWTSNDRGVTWRLAERVSPTEPGVLYSDPVLVAGASPTARLAFTDWSDDESRFFHRMFLWGDEGLVDRDTPLAVARLAGPDRVATAIAVSRQAFPEGARAVVIATQADFPDALAGAPLAAAVNGPILLTSPHGLHDDVAAEIRRLGVKHAIILGGTAAISPAVEDDLRRTAGITTIERIGGRDRYVTGLLIARRMREHGRIVKTALVVSGRAWPDAVSAAPLASANGWPVVLADGDRLPPTSAMLLAEYGIERTIIAGGPAAVGSGVLREVPGATRVGGADRYETSAALAAYAHEHGILPGRVIVATGRDFPDALAAGVLGGRSRAPVLLVGSGAIPESVGAYLAAHSGTLSDLWIIGEPDVVSTAIANELALIAGAR